MSVSTSIQTGPVEKVVIDIGGFVFFADEFWFNRETSRQQYRSASRPSGTFAVTEEYTATFIFTGAFVHREIESICYGEDGIPDKLDVEIRSLFEENTLYEFNNSVVVSTNQSREGGSNEVKVEILAEDMVAHTDNPVVSSL